MTTIKAGNTSVIIFQENDGRMILGNDGVRVYCACEEHDLSSMLTLSCIVQIGRGWQEIGQTGHVDFNLRSSKVELKRSDGTSIVTSLDFQKPKRGEKC